MIVYGTALGSAAAAAGGGAAYPPEDVVSLTAISGNGLVTLLWQDPADTKVGQAVIAAWAGTKIVRKEGSYPSDENDGVLVIDSVQRNQYATTGYVDFGLGNGKTYYYQAFPYSMAGAVNRNANNRTAVMVYAFPPANVIQFVVTPGEAKATLTWVDPQDTTGNEPAVWAGTKIVRNTMRFPADEHDGTLVVDNTVRGQYSTNGFVDQYLEPGATYYYQAFPYSNTGAVNREEANRVLVTLSYIAPGNVVDFTAVGGSKQVTLTWTDPNDQGVPAPVVWAGTMIRRKTGSYPTNETDGALVVDSKTRNQYRSGGFVDVGLINGTEYFYSAFPYSDMGVFNRNTTSRVSVAPEGAGYYGTATSLSVARSQLAATKVGSYALFGGGFSGSAASNVVDVYNTNLARNTTTALSSSRYCLAAATVGNYALFGGGSEYGSGVGSGDSRRVEAFDTNLTRTAPSSLYEGRWEIAATTVGSYALFGGGGHTSIPYSNTVDAYSANLTYSRPTALSIKRRQLAATTVGNYALFGGGEASGTYYNTVDAYDTSLTRTTASSLNTARNYLAATTVGNYALFGGGYTGTAYSAVVTAYNASLTRTSATALSTARRYLTATTAGGYALFGGGEAGSSTNVVDVYDASLTRTATMALDTARQHLAATTIGNYALFGGGRTGASNSTLSNIVDAYTGD